MLGNADVRISYAVVVADLAVLPQRHRRRVRLRRARHGDRRDGLRRAGGRPGRLRDPAAGHHAPVGARPATSRCAPTRSRPTATSPRRKRYLSRYGQLLEHAPYCERDLRGPAEPLLVEGTDVEVYVKHRGDGPGRAGRHRSTSSRSTRSTSSAGTAASTRTPSTSPTSSRSPAGCTSRRRCTRCSRGRTSSICNFVPRKVDYHPLAVPVPYYHSNVDSDEVMFYVDGDYEARKGSGIGKGSISLHPGGHSHGPQPGAVERSLGAEFFDELAVMVDTFRPLGLGEAGTAVGRREVRLVLVGPRALGMTWLDLPAGHRLRPRQPAATGSSRRRTAAAHRRRGSATSCSTSPASSRRRRCTRTGSLNAFLARGPAALARSCARGLRGWLTDEAYRGRTSSRTSCRVDDVTLHLPFEVADYVDFYSSRHHAENLGRMFRPDAEPLTPELEAPADRLPRPRRHGGGVRARRCVRPVRPAQGARRTTSRPSARRSGSTSRPRSGFVVGDAVGARRRRCRSGAFAEHVFGVCLVNDWSARDLQAWEYVPLGPVPRQVVPHLGLAVGRAARRAGGRPGAAAGPRRRRRCPTCDDADAPLGPRPHARGPAQRRARQPAAVRASMYWTAGPAARAPDRQRGRAAHRRPVRLRHGQRPGARPARLAASSCPGTARSR